ncbi:MAG: thiamine diphosphokinase [Bacteroidales bacterium]
MQKIYDCVIVANGEFPTSSIVLGILDQAKMIVACDGAAQTLVAKGYMPHTIVGDLDSLSEEIRKRFAAIVIHNPDQETNDLTKAIGFVKSKGVESVCILAATGLREDHTLANISLLTQYQSLFSEIKLMTDFGVFTAIKDSQRFDSFEKQKISIFSLPPLVPVSVRNLKYPIEERVLNSWWEGSLNESLSDCFEVLLHGEGNVLVYQVYEKKQ